MKIFAQRSLVALMICAVASISVFADKVNKEQVKKTVVFADDTMVNGTLIKAGKYEMKFDEQTGAMQLLKDGDLKATAAHIEKRDTKASSTVVLTVHNGTTYEMVGIEVGGTTQDIMLSNSGAVSGSQ